MPTDFSAEMSAILANQGATVQLDSKRLATIRGHVKVRGGGPLGSVVVSVLGHTELGSTATRSLDGGFDIVVNGGQTYTLQFSAPGYFTVERQAQTRWLDWTVLPDVALVAPENAKSVTFPTTTATCFTYDGSNRLASLIEPLDACVAGSHTHNFSYSASGLLVKDVAPSGGAGTRLTRTDEASAYVVDFSTAESRSTTHTVDMSVVPLATDEFIDPKNQNDIFTRREKRTQSTLASSNPTTNAWYADGSHVRTSPDGLTTSTTYAPDLRFGMNLPYVSALTMTTGTHDGTGTKCAHGWKGFCEKTTRTVGPVGCTGFACTSITDTTTGSFNDYGNTGPAATTIWTSSPSSITRTNSESHTVVYGLDAYDRISSISYPNMSGLDTLSVDYGTSGSSLGKITTINPRDQLSRRA